MQAQRPNDRTQGKRLYRLDKASPITLAASMVRKKLSAHYYFTEFETNEPPAPEGEQAFIEDLSYNWRDMRADFTLTGHREPSPEFYAVFDRVVRIVNLDAKAKLYAIGLSLFFSEEHHIHPKRGVLKVGPPPAPF